MSTKQFYLLMAAIVVSVCIYVFMQPTYVYWDDPVWLTEIHKWKGITETPGDENTAWIEDSFRMCGLPEHLMSDDKTSWCSAGLNKIFNAVGLQGTMDARAYSWHNYGASIRTARRGALCLFFDGTNYHVTLLEKAVPLVLNDIEYYLCIGCNQSNRIKVSPYPVKNLVKIGRAHV